MFNKLSFRISVSKLLAWALLPIYAFQIAIAPSANAFAVTLADTDALKFVKSASTITRISTASSVLTDMGKTAGDIVLYKSVGSFGGVTIDCAVTTVAVDGSVSNYDDPGSASTAAGYLNNFQINTVGGAVTFKFEFFQAGTYTGVNTGIPVILQNVKITSIDLDSSTNAGSYQYTDFTGFQKYSLMSPTNLGVTPMTNPNRVRFIATKTGARSSVPEDQVLVKYDSIQSIQMTFGNVVAGSTNYFGLVFGGWPGTGTPVESSNVYNTPPTSTSETLTVATGVATTIPLSAFGTYADVDNNPFYQVRIATLPGSGTLQYLNGSNWTNVSNGQVISVSDIQLGKLRFTGSSATSLTFSVHDGLDYSATTYTLNIAIAANAQAITFNNPGTKAPNNTPFASNATSNSGLTVILTSDTRGVCTVNGLDITPIATGICVITATQPGDGSYGAAAPVTQTFPVDSKTSQEITFNKPVDRTFSSTPFASGASSNSGLTVTLTSYTPSVCTVSGLNIVMVSTGICQIRATQDGNASVAPAVPVDQNFLITPGAPVVNTNPATAVGSGTGTLNGTINTFGLPTTSLGFCLATSNTVSAGALTCSETITVTGETTTVVVSKLSVKSGLTNGTTYYYQLVGTTSGGTSYGQVQSFTPVAASTIMATTVQIDASSSGSATLMGTVNAGGNAQTISFCWNSSNSIVGNPSINDINVNGILSNCTNVAASPSSDSTNSNVNVTANLSNLRSDTNYYYQVRISKGGGNYVYGKILLFRTSSSKATTISATKTSSTATLNASGQSGSSRSSASTRICYNSTGEVSSIGILQTNLTTPEIAGCLTGSPSSIRSSSSDQNYSANLSGLTPNKTYYYQAYVSRSSSNYSYGEIKTFTTDPVAPAVTTQPATGIAGSKAHLNGTVVANAASATNSFCWGTASNLSGCTTEAAPDPLTSSGNAQTSVTVVIEGLTAGTTYYYRAISTNGTGTTNGSILSFIAGSPLAITSSPSSVASTSAVLNGAIKSNNLDTTATFCIGTSPTTSASGALSTCSSVSATPNSILGSTTAPTSISVSRSGLSAGTTYYYQAIATSGARVNYGSVVSFVAAGEPTPVTVAASSITSDGATLNGTIAPNGATAKGYFCISSVNSQKEIVGILDTCIGGVQEATNTSSNNWALDIVGTKPATKYYFQIIGENSVGTKYGAILDFTTLPGDPVAATHQPVVYGTTATLNGEVESSGSNTAVTFCWGTASDLSGCSSVSANPASVSETTTVAVSVSYDVSGLTAGTTYYYRVKAINSTNNPVYGSILSFTAGAPTVSTDPASNVAATTATLNGTVKSNGSDVTSIKYCYFSSVDYPSVDADGGLTNCAGGSPAVARVNASITSVLASETSTVSAPLNVSGLNPGDTYYYQIVAINSRGTAYGEVESFYFGIPFVTTSTPTSVSRSGATIRGVVNPNGASSVDGKLCLSVTDEATGGVLSNCSQEFIILTAQTGTSNLNMSQAVSGLIPSTTYFYQASAIAGDIMVVGEILSFTTTSPGVTFNLNDGSGTTANQSSATPTTLTLQSNLVGFTRSGYTFAGWNTNADGTSGIGYSDGANYAFDADLTLFAKWTAIAVNYTVTYDPNSGSVSPTSATYSSSALTLPTPSRSGYSFNGWYTSPSGGTRIGGSGSSYTPSGNVTLYAQWSANSSGSAPSVEPTPTPSPTPRPTPTVTPTPTPSPTVSASPKASPSPSPTIVKVATFTLVTKTSVKAAGSLVQLKQVKVEPTSSPSPSSSPSRSASPTSSPSPSSSPSRSTTPSPTPSGSASPTSSPSPSASSSATLDPSNTKVVSVGTGVSNVAVTNTNVVVTPASGFSGKTTVVVSTLDGGVQTTVKIPVIVNPLEPITPVVTPVAPTLSTITWKTDPSAIRYQVNIDGKLACISSTNSCNVLQLVGPAADVTVQAKGNSQTQSAEVDAAYVAKKPVTALVVHFENNSAVLNAVDKIEIKALAKTIAAQGFKNVVIAGHTDKNTGVDNQALSQARAEATLAYLKKVAPKINAKIGAFASTKPVASGSSEEALAANRRAEIGVY